MTMKKILLTIVILCLFNSPNVFAGDRLPSLLVSNAWKLVETDKGLPSKMFIKEYKMTFLPDGNWSFNSELTGKYAGMKMNGSGTWRVKEETLIYTAGDNSGKSQIEIKDGILRLNPDPVVVFNGIEPVATIYEID